MIIIMQEINKLKGHYLMKKILFTQEPIELASPKLMPVIIGSILCAK